MQEEYEDNRLPVAICATGDYSPHISALLISLFRNNKDLKFKIYIIGDNFLDGDKDKLLSIVRAFGSSILFKMCDRRIFEGCIVKDHFDISNYYRLCIPDLISENYCLYLDADIIVAGNISSIFEIGLSDYFLAAAPDLISSWNNDLNLLKDAIYFNSGVMLINCKMWRKNNILNRVVDFVERNPDKIRYVDQCGLNAIVNGHFHVLPVSFNFQLSPDQVGHAQTNEFIPKIIHFSGPNKPWLFETIHPYKNIYWEYRDMELFPISFGEYYSLRSICKRYLPSSIFNVLLSVYLRFKNAANSCVN